MNYFKIKESLIAKEIGIFPQSITANHLVSINSPLGLTYHGFDTIFAEDILIPEPILRKTAKRTDLISCVSIPAKLVISDKIKDILEKYNRDDIQYLKVNVIFKDQKVAYWLASSHKYEMSFIDYSTSEVWLDGMGGVPINREIFSTYEMFLERKNAIKLPERLNIRETVLSTKKITKDCFVLRSTGAGICYVVSEKVKTEIEQAGCTGIAFELFEQT